MTDHVGKMATDAADMAIRAEAFEEGKRQGIEMMMALLARDYASQLTPLVAAAVCLQGVSHMIGEKHGVTWQDAMVAMSGELVTLAEVMGDDCDDRV